MAYVYDYATLTITVPQSDLTLVSGTLYDLDTKVFKETVADEQDSDRGIPFVNAISHNTEVTVAGTTFARTIELINGWSLTFEDLPNYTVRLVGSNNNLFDVANGILNQNQVQVISTNSAGLITVDTGGTALTAQQTRDAMLLETTGGDASVDTKLNNNFAISAAGL